MTVVYYWPTRRSGQCSTARRTWAEIRRANACFADWGFRKTEDRKTRNENCDRNNSRDGVRCGGCGRISDADASARPAHGGRRAVGEDVQGAGGEPRGLRRSVVLHRHRLSSDGLAPCTRRAPRALRGAASGRRHRAEPPVPGHAGPQRRPDFARGHRRQDMGRIHRKRGRGMQGLQLPAPACFSRLRPRDGAALRRVQAGVGVDRRRPAHQQPSASLDEE